MVQNIAIVGLNRSQAYETAKLLAEELDMHFFDSLELFEFDNIPRTFQVMLEEYGERYYRKKEKGIIGYSGEFTECVLNFEGGVAELKTNLKEIKKNSLLIYIDVKAETIKNKLEKIKYNSTAEKKFYNIPLSKINKRIDNLKSLADITINANSGSQLKIVSNILRAIKKYYTKK